MARIGGLGALAWTAVILWITLSPEQPTDGGWVRDALAWLGERGLPAWVNYDFIEVAANVALFVPFGLLLALSFPRALILWPTVLGLALSLSIEFTQAAFLPARFATVSDLVANTAGAFLGTGLVAFIRNRGRGPKRRLRVR